MKKSIKLSKKMLLFVTAGFIAVLGIGLGIIQPRQINEEKQLEQELSLVLARLNMNISVSQTSTKEDLLTRHAEFESLVIQVKSELTEIIETIEVNSTLFEIAGNSGVKILDISSSVPIESGYQEIEFSTLSQRVSIEGSLAGITSFIFNWTETFQTGLVVAVDISSLEDDEGGNSYKANLNLLVHTWQGD